MITSRISAASWFLGGELVDRPAAAAGVDESDALSDRGGKNWRVAIDEDRCLPRAMIVRAAAVQDQADDGFRTKDARFGDQRLGPLARHSASEVRRLRDQNKVDREES